MSRSIPTLDPNAERPLISQVKSQIRGRIRRRDLPIGSKLPSMRSLSRDMGCSLGVVQMAINGLTAEGQLRSTPRKGVYVAEPRITKRDVALVLPTLRLEQMDSMIRGVRTGLRDTELHLMVQAADADFDDQVHLLDHLDEQYVAGVVICPPTSDDYAPPLSRFLERDIPVVQATHQLDGLEMDTITVDAFEMGRLAVQHIVKRGHQRIGLVGFGRKSRSAKDRFHGVMKALSLCDIAPDSVTIGNIDETLLNDDLPWEASEQAATALLRESPDITAIIASSHYVGLGVHRAARNLKLSMPDELSIVTLGSDLQSFSFIEPAMTVVEDPLEAVCERAVLRLRQLIDGDAGPVQTVHLPPRIIERESVSDISTSS